VCECEFIVSARQRRRLGEGCTKLPASSFPPSFFLPAVVRSRQSGTRPRAYVRCQQDPAKQPSRAAEASLGVAWRGEERSPLPHPLFHVVDVCCNPPTLVFLFFAPLPSLSLPCHVKPSTTDDAATDIESLAGAEVCAARDVAGNAHARTGLFFHCRLLLLTRIPQRKPGRPRRLGVAGFDGRHPNRIARPSTEHRSCSPRWCPHH
jgi:hypothetical protein